MGSPPFCQFKKMRIWRKRRRTSFCLSRAQLKARGALTALAFFSRLSQDARNFDDWGRRCVRMAEHGTRRALEWRMSVTQAKDVNSWDHIWLSVSSSSQSFINYKSTHHRRLSIKTIIESSSHWGRRDKKGWRRTGCRFVRTEERCCWARRQTSGVRCSWLAPLRNLSAPKAISWH